MANTTSTSPYGPNIRTGRGGAGNFIWQSDLEKRSKDDPEAALPATVAEAIDASIPPPQPSTGQVYVNTGRGGAGNTVTSSQLADNFSPSTKASHAAHTSMRSTVPSAAPQHGGRGGAGNFQAYSAKQQKQSQKEEKEREEREEQVRKAVAEDVESGLQKPPGAWIQVPPGRERE